ncbi:flagellar motor switch protein FliG [Nostoc sp. HG1]|nr:flagellar motor switch protein FliG [Nostoc sp. HG1]
MADDSVRDLVKTMRGAHAAAILLMLLEDTDAATILKEFEPQEVRSIGSAMFDAANSGEADIELALDLFIASNHTVSSLAVGASTRIRAVMHEALGNVRADNILADIAPTTSANLLDILRWMEIPAIAEVLASEHPQVAAIILAVLTPEAAAAAVEGLPEAVQVDLIWRAARLSSIPAHAIDDLEAILTAASDRVTAVPEMKLGGRSDVAKIVNNLTRPASEKLLRSLRKKDRALADSIEEEMFVFDNLEALDDKTLGAVMRNVEASEIALAIKGASAVMAARLLSTLSQRAAQTITDEIADMGPVKRSDVDDAQKAVVGVARRMAASGEIMLGGKGDDYV